MQRLPSFISVLPCQQSTLRAPSQSFHCDHLPWKTFRFIAHKFCAAVSIIALKNPAPAGPCLQSYQMQFRPCAHCWTGMRLPPVIGILLECTCNC